jgi:hypothetical protein
MNENQPKYRYGDPHPTRRDATGRPWRRITRGFISPDAYDNNIRVMREERARRIWGPDPVTGKRVYLGLRPKGETAATPAAPATYVFDGRAVSTQRWAAIPARPPTEANLRHNAALADLKRALIAEHGEANVRTDSRTADGKLIDAAVRLPNGLFQIYEVKTAEVMTAKLCIRQALGQLLEYAKSPGMTAAGITVVGTVPPTREDALYLDRLNKDHCLNINYRQVNDAV